jgi:hypothetical protein
MSKRNIWYKDPYIYTATASGVTIYNVDLEYINNIQFQFGVNSVWANNDYVYMGTSVSGVYRCLTNTISGTPLVERYKYYPDITSDTITYVHGKDDYLCVSTISGIDRIRLSTNDREHIVEDAISKCFQTSIGDYYYITNSFCNIIGLDDNLFGWDYGRVLELSFPIPTDDYQFTFEIPRTQPDDIYLLSQEDGADIRIIDDSGVLVSYYIESWASTTPLKIWTNLSKGTKSLYIIYGNSKVKSKSDAKSTFKLFEDFNAPTLSNLWIFNNSGYNNNTYTIANSIIRLNTYSNSYPLYLYSTNFFKECILEYSFRMISGSSDNNDMDWSAGFNSGTNAYIGSINNNVDELPHYLSSASSSGTIYGNTLASTSFATHTIIESSNYQMSSYGGETLSSSGILNNTALKQIKFTYNNAYYQPKIEIDWVRVRNYDPTPPLYTVGRGCNISDLFSNTALHAIYDNGVKYTYYGRQGNIINSQYISDIYITEGTSKNGEGNVIFLATSWGVTVIEEKRGDEINSSKRVYLLSS